MLQYMRYFSARNGYRRKKRAAPVIEASCRCLIASKGHSSALLEWHHSLAARVLTTALCRVLCRGQYAETI